MSKQEELEKEYSLFLVKIAKTSKDFNDTVSELSPENLKRFKQEMKSILPQELIKLIQNLNN